VFTAHVPTERGALQMTKARAAPFDYVHEGTAPPPLNFCCRGVPACARPPPSNAMAPCLPRPRSPTSPPAPPLRDEEIRHAAARGHPAASNLQGRKSPSSNPPGFLRGSGLRGRRTARTAPPGHAARAPDGRRQTATVPPTPWPPHTPPLAARHDQESFWPQGRPSSLPDRVHFRRRSARTRQIGGSIRFRDVHPSAAPSKCKFPPS